MKKILCVILPIILAFALAGTAFSAWQFESSDKAETALTGIRDDIFENYDIKKADDAEVNSVKTYEIYLFPSTLYLNDYLDFLGGEYGAVLPEEKYGWIEPSVDKSGNVIYTVAGQGGDRAYLTEVAQNTTFVMSDTAITADMYYSVYKGNSNWDKSGDAGLSGTVKLGTQTVSANSKFLYGDPVLDNTVLKYGYGDEQHGWRNLHYFDRFGYWPSVANGSGRYLPLKITVDENFSNTYYDKVVMSPFADMGDPHNWYVYAFSCWAYIYFNSDGTYSAPYYATEDFATANSGTNYVNNFNGKVSANPSLGSFCPTMVSQYFDIIESFEKYADSDGIIRLFPKFSNGKGYLAKTVKDGGGDSIKALPVLKDDNGNKTEMTASDRHEVYMFYSTETGKVAKGTKSANVHVSVLPNIDIDDYFSLNFKIALTESTAGWSGGWTDIFLFGREETSDGNKNIPETLKSYGYGLYNLYLFVTQVAESKSTLDYTESLEEMRKNLVDKSDNENFPSLFGKNLLPIATAYTGGKSFMLVAEKVREAKFIGDVNFGNTNYTTEEQVEAKYLSTNKSFRLINKELYGYEKGSSVEGESAINSQFPYCYILQNVDFTEATTQYCQIRFQRNYRSDLHFAEPDEYKYDRIEYSGVIYERGFGNYFNLVNASVHSQDGTAETQQVIQLASEEMRGVYDIILVFRSAREGNSQSDIAYNIGLYAYRHTNIFLKIYENDLTGKVNYYQGSDGAFTGTDGEGSGKAYEFVDHSALPLFNKSYPIGVSVNGTDGNDGGSVNPIGSTLAECVNGAVKGQGYDPTNVKLCDHVTGAEVAYYELKAGVTTNAENYYLEYGGKYYELVFNPFKIRKNYIFYISYE